MAEIVKARVFMSGRRQHVTIPAEYRFTRDEMHIRRDPQTGDLILSEAPRSAGFSDDFMADREQGATEKREEL